MQMQNEQAAAQEGTSAAYQMFRDFSLSRTCSVQSSTPAYVRRTASGDCVPSDDSAAESSPILGPLSGPKRSDSGTTLSGSEAKKLPFSTEAAARLRASNPSKRGPGTPPVSSGSLFYANLVSKHQKDSKNGKTQHKPPSGGDNDRSGAERTPSGGERDDGSSGGTGAPNRSSKVRSTAARRSMQRRRSMSETDLPAMLAAAQAMQHKGEAEREDATCAEAEGGGSLLASLAGLIRR